MPNSLVFPQIILRPAVRMRQARWMTVAAFLMALVMTTLLTGCNDQASTAQVHGLPDFSGLVAANNDSVVNVRAIVPLSAISDNGDGVKTPSANDKHLDEFFRQFFGFNGQTPPSGDAPNAAPPAKPESSSGSGFILSSDGYILTNEHVVDGASEVFVRLLDGREFRAKVQGSDLAGDIALLKIDAKDLHPVKLGNSDEVKPGQWAVAIGSPFGFDHSVTAGVISAKGRSLPGEAGQRYVPFLQTDVAINPGSSGGPLFNVNGEVVGINSQIFTESGGYNGLSFAIPINYAMQVVDQLKRFGKVERGFLGVQIQSVDRAMASALGLDRPTGALITGFIAASPAEKSDLQPGDVILSANGEPITESSDLPQVIGILAPDTEVKLRVLTQGKQHTVVVRLGTLPSHAPAQIQSMKSHDLIINDYGLLLTEESHQIRIKAVEPNGPAAKAGLSAQDILLTFNQHPLDSLEAAQQAFNTAKKDEPNAVLIRRGDQQHFLSLSTQPD
ncbi:MAG: Do family serine endopeptidase [Halothiobacillus sp.]|jgi:serine protease Do|nr:Do family serine endopeptidase [Halothiobacillus sp.]